MALTDIKLRILTDALLTTKGSRLTMQEVDTNFKELVAQIVALNANSGGSIEAYNAGTTYTGGLTYYVSYAGNIYKFISATDQTAQTPGSYPAIWELTSAGAMVHQQGTDQSLDLNGDYEISAADIYNFLARYNGILKPALDFADGLSAPPSSTDGDIYIIQAGTSIESTAINWQSGTTVRFSYAATDLSSYSIGMYLDVQNALDSVHDGQWLISAVNDGSDYIEVTNPNVTDATNDSTTSDTYVSHGDWGGVAQNSWVVKDAITVNWEEIVPFDGLQCYNIAEEETIVYNATNEQWQFSKGYMSYIVHLAQASTSAPSATIIKNQLGFTPSYAYDAVGSYSSLDTGWQDFLSNKVNCYANVGNILGATVDVFNSLYDYEVGGLRLATYRAGSKANDILIDGDIYYPSSLEVKVFY